MTLQETKAFLLWSAVAVTLIFASSALEPLLTLL